MDNGESIILCGISVQITIIVIILSCLLSIITINVRRQTKQMVKIEQHLSGLVNKGVEETAINDG